MMKMTMNMIINRLMMGKHARQIMNDVIDDDLLKDLDKLHDMKVIDDSVKKKANNHLLSKS